MVESKKDKAFQLFAEGKLPISPELKALKLKGSTRYNYYYSWQRQGGITASPESRSEAKVKGSKVISELEMVVPSEEVKGKKEEEAEGEEELRGDEPEMPEPGGEDEGDEPEKPKPEEKKGTPPTDGKSPQILVAGQGHTYIITISTKTVMFYQFAASQIGEELTLGDFCDACVEDSYQARGLDLGMVKEGGKNG